MPKINPCLWFDSDADQAAKFYTSVFENAKIGKTSRYGESASEISGQKKGSVLTVEFEAEGLTFEALNGGPLFKFSPAVSFFVYRKTPKDVEDLWNKLSRGGSVLMELQKYPWSEKYGWCKDKYGVSWQVVPATMGEIMSDKDPAKVERAMKVMLKMKKLDIETLKQAMQ